MSGYLDPGAGGWYPEEEEPPVAPQYPGYDPGYVEPEPEPEYVAGDGPGYTEYDGGPTYAPEPAYEPPALPAADVGAYEAAAAQVGYTEYGPGDYVPPVEEYGPGYNGPGYQDDPATNPFAAYESEAYYAPAGPQYAGYDPGEYVASAATDYFDPFGNLHAYDPNARSGNFGFDPETGRPTGILAGVDQWYTNGEANYNPYLSGIAEQQLDLFFNYYDDQGNYVHAPGVVDDAFQEQRNYERTQQVGPAIADWYTAAIEEAGRNYEDFQVQTYAEGKRAQERAYWDETYRETVRGPQQSAAVDEFNRGMALQGQAGLTSREQDYWDTESRAAWYGPQSDRDQQEDARYGFNQAVDLIQRGMSPRDVAAQLGLSDQEALHLQSVFRAVHSGDRAELSRVERDWLAAHGYGGGFGYYQSREPVRSRADWVARALEPIGMLFQGAARVADPALEAAFRGALQLGGPGMGQVLGDTGRAIQGTNTAFGGTGQGGPATAALEGWDSATKIGGTLILAQYLGQTYEQAFASRERHPEAAFWSDQLFGLALDAATAKFGHATVARMSPTERAAAVGSVLPEVLPQAGPPPAVLSSRATGGGNNARRPVRAPGGGGPGAGPGAGLPAGPVAVRRPEFGGLPDPGGLPDRAPGGPGGLPARQAAPGLADPYAAETQFYQAFPEPAVAPQRQPQAPAAPRYAPYDPQQPVIYHGSPRQFPAEEIQPGRPGMVGSTISGTVDRPRAVGYQQALGTEGVLHAYHPNYTNSIEINDLPPQFKGVGGKEFDRLFGELRDEFGQPYDAIVDEAAGNVFVYDRGKLTPIDPETLPGAQGPRRAAAPEGVKFRDFPREGGQGVDNVGWKLHLAVETDPRLANEIADFLDSQGIGYKIGRSGDPDKGMTIYAGARDDYEDLAVEIDRMFGDRLPDLPANPTGDERVVGNVFGRFDTHRTGDFGAYGSEGHPVLKSDIMQQLWGRGGDRKLTPEMVRRGRSEAARRYGDFYTGTRGRSAPTVRDTSPVRAGREDVVPGDFDGDTPGTPEVAEDFYEGYRPPFDRRRPTRLASDDLGDLFGDAQTPEARARAEAHRDFTPEPEPPIIDGQGGTFHRPFERTREGAGPTKGAEPRYERYTDRQIRLAARVWESGKARPGMPVERARYIVHDLDYLPRERVARIVNSRGRGLPGMSTRQARQVLSDVDYRGTGARPEYEQAVDVPRARVGWEPRERKGIRVDDLGRWNPSDAPKAGDRTLQGERGHKQTLEERRAKGTSYQGGFGNEAQVELVRSRLVEARGAYEAKRKDLQHDIDGLLGEIDFLGVRQGRDERGYPRYIRGQMADVQADIRDAVADKRWGDVKALVEDMRAYGAERRSMIGPAKKKIEELAAAAKRLNALESRYARLTDDTVTLDLPEADSVDAGLGGQGFEPGLRPREIPAAEAAPLPAGRPVQLHLLGVSAQAKEFVKKHGNNFAVAAPGAMALGEEDEESRALWLLAAGVGLGGVGVYWGRRSYGKYVKATEAARLPGRMQTPIGKKFWRIDSQRNEIAAIVSEDLRDKIASSGMAVGKAGNPAKRRAETIKALQSYVNHGYFPGMLRPLTPASALRDTQVRNALELVGRDLHDRLPTLVREAAGEADFQLRVQAAVDEALKAHLGVSKRGPLVSVPEKVHAWSTAVILKGNPGWALKNVADGYVQRGYAKGLGQLGMQRTGKSKELVAAATKLEQSGAFGPAWLDAEVVQDIARGDSLYDRYNPILKAVTNREVAAKTTIFRTHYDNYFTTALARELGLTDRFMDITKYLNANNPTAKIAGGRLAFLPDKARRELLGVKDLAEARRILRREIADDKQFADALAVFNSHQRDARDYARSTATVAMRNYAERSNLDVALSVVYPFHYWTTRGVVWNAHLAARYPLAAAAVAAATLWTLDEWKDLPLADKVDTKIPIRPLVEKLLPEALQGEILEALDWYRDEHNGGAELTFGLLDWAAPSAVAAVKGADPKNLKNLMDITDPVNLALAAERLFGWKGRSVAWGVTDDILRAREKALPDWLRLALKAGDPMYAPPKGAYYQGAAGAYGDVARGLAERAGAGKVPRAVNEVVYGSADAPGERSAIRAIMRDRGVGEDEARKIYFGQQGKRAGVSLLGVPSKGPNRAADDEPTGVQFAASGGQVGGPGDPYWGGTPSERNFREQEKAVRQAERRPRELHERKYGPEPAKEYGRNAWWTAYNTQQMGDTPSESNASQGQIVRASQARNSADRAERMRFMLETNDYIQAEVAKLIASGQAENKTQAYGLPLAGLGGKSAYEFWLAEDPDYDPMKFVKTGEEHQRGSSGMGGGMFAGIGSYASQVQSRVVGERAAIWDEYFDRKLTDPKGATAWLNSPYGQSGMTRVEYANSVQKDQGLNLTGPAATPRTAPASAPAGATAPSTRGATGTRTSATSSRASGTGGARTPTSTRSTSGASGNSSAAGTSARGAGSASGPKTEYGRQVASFFATHGQPPPKGTPEADAYWRKNGAAWRETFGSGSSGSTPRSGGGSSSGSRGTTAAGARPTSAGRRESSTPFDRWLEVERPDLKAKIRRSSPGLQGPGEERDYEPGVTAKETAAAWNGWEPLHREGRATVGEAVPILEAHARSGGDPAPYVRRAKFGVYEQIRAWRGETRQGGDRQRGKWFAAVKALPDTVEGLKKLAAIEREVRGLKGVEDSQQQRPAEEPGGRE